MRLRRIPEAMARVHGHPLVITETQAMTMAGCWRRHFGADNPLHLEIGMGRGLFLTRAAAAHTRHNYVGLERRAEPIDSALERLTAPYPANLRLLHADAALLTRIFAPGELDVIYLHFPDPWPKSRHAKRRLTAPAFLSQYQQILQPAGVLIFKTDGAAFYQWSCANFKQAGWQLARSGEDWPLTDGEIISGYEQRFRALGQPVCYAEFRKM
ncbi:MAG: tRNA (guanosine(46)-N7)-methyltransferase TrmB [Clostridiales bacterium]|nr:tRNA (guanosine(46)-N7)-methyltransferase TrmB [Clostridiales bacterium]